MSDFATLRKQSLDISAVREFLDYPESFKMEEGTPLIPDLEIPYQIELREVSFRYPKAEKNTLSHISLTIRPGDLVYRFDIEFRNVSFRYTGQDSYALRNVSLTFNEGQRLAVVGMNGSGKTTFIKLLCRLYDPTEGEILLNGIDIRKYKYAKYMRLFSVVFEDFKLLSFELGQNIAGSMDYDSEKATCCLRDAGFEICPGKLSRGLSTTLYKDFDEQGVNIFGGEAQKIALTQALP